MKSKVCLFSIFWILCIKLNESKPTFGDEFVHIKVHLLNEGDPSHLVVHAPLAPPSYNVVHHFHSKRRKPPKKTEFFGEHTGLLEDIIFSEVKKPIGSDHYKHVDHAGGFVEYLDTYKLIEKTKPKQTVENFEVIESKVPQTHYKPHEEPYHLLNIAPTDSVEEGYHYKPHKHTETFKVIEGLLDNYHTHVQDPGNQYLPSKKKRIKTADTVESHEHESGGHNGHNDCGSQEFVTLDNKYHYVSKPHFESVKVPQTKAPHQHSQEPSFNIDKRPHSETIEIVKTNKHSKSNSYHNRHLNHQLFDGSQKYHGSDDTDDGFPAGYDYKTQTFEDTYRTKPEEHYAEDLVQYAHEDSYLLPNPPSSAFYHYYEPLQNSEFRSNMSQNLLFDDKPVPASNGALPSPDESFLSPQTLALPELDYGAHSDAAHSAQHDPSYKVTETYSGIDSYNAAHVQGLGSGAYKYPSPHT